MPAPVDKLDVPFQQGGLDALCGPYAVVNAVRLVARPHRRLGRAACCQLFGHLADELEGRGLLRSILTEGCDAGTMAKLLKQASAWLARYGGLQLQIERPFVGPDRHKPRELPPLLTAHMSGAQRAAILDTGDHWTVARQIATSQILLYDSNGRSYLLLGKANRSEWTRRLVVRSTFLLKIG